NAPQAARAIGASGDGASARGHDVVLINPRMSAIQQNFGASVARDDHRVGWPASADALASKAIDRDCLHAESPQIPARLAPRLSAACLAATPVAKEELPTT